MRWSLKSREKQREKMAPMTVGCEEQRTSLELNGTGEGELGS